VNHQDNTDRQPSRDELLQELARLRQRVAELEAADSEHRRLEKDVERTFSLSPMLMCIVGMDGTIRRVNAAYQHTYGHAEADLLGRRQVEFLHPDDAAASSSFTGQLVRGEPVFNVHTRICRPDGSVRRLVWTGIPLAEAGGILCIGQDATEQKHTEESLRENQRRLATLMSNLPGMAYRCRNAPDWPMEFVSEGCLLLTGYQPSELLGSRSVSFGEIIDAQDRQMVWDQVQQAVAQRRHFQIEYRIHTAQGQEEWVWEQGMPVFSTNGELVAIEGLIINITEQKRTEEALRKARDELERRVEERTAELSEANRQLTREVDERKQAEESLLRERRTLEYMLRASDHERQVIAYDIHDGLAQELAGAIMQFETYDRVKDTRPDDAVNAFHAGITLLKQGHFEARRLISGLRPPVLDESGVVEAIAHLVHEQNRATAAKIDVHHKIKFDRLPPVLENAIYRIVQEGLANACNHSKSPRISVRLVQYETRLRIEIRDWGTGFDPKNVPVNRFGLTGIRERARLLGGKSRIQSTPGEGTRISVELPLLFRTNGG
jgi:PAS domain S-box-containing protein